MTTKQKLLRHCESLLFPYQYNESIIIASVVNHKLSLFIRQRQQQRQSGISSRRSYHNSNHTDDNNNNTDIADDADSTVTATATVHPPPHPDVTSISNIISSTIPYMGQGIKVGQYATLERSYNSEDVDNFSRLIQDFNPLHSSSSSLSSSSPNNINMMQLQRNAHENSGLIQYEEDDDVDDDIDIDDDNPHTNTDTDTDTDTDKTQPKTRPKALVHGIFVSSIFSSIFASIAPGCVYVNQSLDFISPIFVHDIIIGCISIEKTRRTRRKKKLKGAGGGIVVQCQTRIYKYKNVNMNTTNNGRKILQQPQQAQMAVKGHANLWLPIGYEQE